MTEPMKFRTVIVGCGRISVIHIAAIKALGNVEIVAVCDLDEKLAQARASQHSIPNVYTDMETMLKEMKPDVVHLLTPPRSHLALIKIAGKYRVNVYVEKPLASSVADALAIIDVGQEAGIKLCPGHSLLFEPLFLETCRRIRDGEIGQVISVCAEQGFTYEAAARSAEIPWSYTYDWGIFDNLMPHPLYMVSHFLKNPGQPQVVGFNLGRVREAAVEEMRVLIPAANAIGEVSLSLCNSPEVNRLEIVGTAGRIMVDFISLTLLSMPASGLPGALTRFTSNFNIATKLARSSLGVAFAIVRGKVKRYMGIRGLVAAFYRSLREDSVPPVQPEQGVLNVHQMEEIKKACQNMVKRRVPVQSSSEEAATPRLLVTGASGCLGGRLVERLSTEGLSVRATTRLPSRARPLPGVQWVQCDLSREDELYRALSGVETVFHCAAMVGPPGSLKDYEDINVKGTIRLAGLAAKAGVKNLIYISSLSVYGDSGAFNHYLDETAPYEQRAKDRGIYTQTKLEADKALLNFVSQQNGHRGVPRIIILRPGSIYGPGAKLPLGRFPLPSSKRRPIITGSRRVPMPLTYVDNLIDAMLAAARSNSPTGSVYNVVDSAELNQGEVSRTLREVSGGRIRPLFVPYPFVWLLMLGVDLLSMVRNHKMGTARFRLKRTLADMRFKCIAACKDLGWEPRVCLTEGMIRAYESQRETP